MKKRATSSVFPFSFTLPFPVSLPESQKQNVLFKSWSELGSSQLDKPRQPHRDDFSVSMESVPRECSSGSSAERRLHSIRSHLFPANDDLGSTVHGNATYGEFFHGKVLFRFMYEYVICETRQVLFYILAQAALFCESFKFVHASNAMPSP